MPEHQTTPQEWYDRLVNFIKTENQIPMFWRWSEAFDWMFSNGLIEESIEELKKFRDSVELKMFAEKGAYRKAQLQDVNDNIMREIIKNKIDADYTKEAIDSQARKEFVIKKLSHLCEK